MNAVLERSEAIDPALFRSVMGRFATGVTVIGWRDGDGLPAAMTANAFLSVSLEPALVLVSVRRASRLAAALGVGDCYGVSFLGEDQQALSAHFGGRPVADLPLPFTHGEAVPLIDGALAQIVAEVVDIHPAGDHLLCIGRVLRLLPGRPAAPLLFSAGQYRRLEAARQPVYCWDCIDGW